MTLSLEQHLDYDDAGSKFVFVHGSSMKLVSGVWDHKGLIAATTLLQSHAVVCDRRVQA